MRELPEYSDSAEKSQYLNLVTINDEADIQKHLSPLFTSPPPNFAFRGVNDESFKLFSTIQRRWS